VSALRVRYEPQVGGRLRIWARSTKVEHLIELARILDAAGVPGTVRGSWVLVEAEDVDRAVVAIARRGVES
jgi:hypothetical protein